jgi:hypothetical protein
MTNPLLKIVAKNELRSEKRVLPQSKPMPLVPPVFEIDLVDMTNKGIKWYYALNRFL